MCGSNTWLRYWFINLDFWRRWFNEFIFLVCTRLDYISDLVILISVRSYLFLIRFRNSFVTIMFIAIMFVAIMLITIMFITIMFTLLWCSLSNQVMAFWRWDILWDILLSFLIGFYWNNKTILWVPEPNIWFPLICPRHTWYFEGNH